MRRPARGAARTPHGGTNGAVEAGNRRLACVHRRFRRSRLSCAVTLAHARTQVDSRALDREPFENSLPSADRLAAPHPSRSFGRSFAPFVPFACVGAACFGISGDVADWRRATAAPPIVFGENRRKPSFVRALVELLSNVGVLTHAEAVADIDDVTTVKQAIDQG